MDTVYDQSNGFSDTLVIQHVGLHTTECKIQDTFRHDQYLTSFCFSWQWFASLHKQSIPTCGSKTYIMIASKEKVWLIMIIVPLPFFLGD